MNNRSIQLKHFISTLLLIVLTISIAGAQDNATEDATVSPTLTVAPTPVEIIIKEAKFKVPPTVRLRPLNSEIEKDKDGIVELFMNNPILNDVSLEVDISISIPSGIYVYGAGGMLSGGPGIVYGHFSVPPGFSHMTIIHIKESEIGDFPVHFSGIYWPDGDKEKWNAINLDKSFEVKTEKTKPSITDMYFLIYIGIFLLILSYFPLMFIIDIFRGTKNDKEENLMEDDEGNL